MIDAEDHNSFFFKDKKIKNLKELLDVLQNPEYVETAKQHITDTNNDYANWIRHVLKNDELADKISKEKDINVISSIIEESAKETIQTPQDSDAAQPTEISDINLKKYEDEKKEHIESDSHLKVSTENHEAILKKSTEPRHFCPKFFDCMKKEFLFGLSLGIIIGVVIAVFIKIGAI